MKFQNLLRFWLRGIPEASVLHNDRFLASRDPRWVTMAVILSETFFVRWLEKSLYDCLEVLHGSFTDYGARSVFVSGMLESKMAAMMTVFDCKNLGFL